MTYYYASFDEQGRGKSVAASPVPQDWPHPFEGPARPQDLYLSEAGEVKRAVAIDVNLSRHQYLADGADKLEIDAPETAWQIEPPGETETAEGEKIISPRAGYSFEALRVRFAFLATYQAEAAARVDAAAAAQRAGIITISPGQEAVYSAKRAEAARFIESDGEAGPFFYVSSIEEARAITDRAAACDAQLAEIERWRLERKAAIMAAGSLAEIKEAEREE